jgi:gamma-glutamyltranspeptidase/glutathione hydrolase
MRDFHFPGRGPAYGTHGMAATCMPAATLAALDTLRAGGNALDAAIAAVALLGVIEPAMTGTGGDCFCLYQPAGAARPVALNGSGPVPAGLSLDLLESRGVTALEETSPHAVTLPGAVSAWETLLAAHGTKGLDELLQPAVRAAEDGYVVQPRVAHDWADAADKLRETGAGAIFLPGGAPPRPGDRVRNPALATTLRAIAKGGARAFYEGEIATEMVAALRGRGGVHTEADFAAARTAAHFVEPISLPWRGFEVWECPPNGSGLVALMLLGLLEGWSPVAEGPLSADRLHRHLEAARLVYRDRDAFLADPAQAAVPVAKLLDPAYLASLRGFVRPDSALRDLPRAGEAVMPNHKDTTYLAVVDRDGNACSLINSLYAGFGSGILAERSGVLLHNRGLGFRLERGHPNALAPGKRPMHTIIPAMLTERGRAVMAFGVMGGHFQPMGQTLFLTNHIDYGLDIQEALDLPRAMALGGEVQVEPGIPLATVDVLARRGHRVQRTSRPLGGGQAVAIDHGRGVLIGASDPRKDGLALGL